MTSIWTTINRFPPFVVRLLARTRERKPRPLTSEEIAKASNLSLPYVLSLAEMENWDYLPVAHMKAFCLACGIDFGDARNMARHLHFCRKRGPGKWRYLRHDPNWETVYKPLMLMGKKGTP